MSKPQGVRIIRPDGEPIECDDILVHDGVGEDGVDVWRIPYEAGFRPDVDHLECYLPGRTSLGLTVRADQLPAGSEVSWVEEPAGRIGRLFGRPRERREIIE